MPSCCASDLAVAAMISPKVLSVPILRKATFRVFPLTVIGALRPTLTARVAAPELLPELGELPVLPLVALPPLPPLLEQAVSRSAATQPAPTIAVLRDVIVKTLLAAGIKVSSAPLIEHPAARVRRDSEKVNGSQPARVAGQPCVALRQGGQ